MSGITGSVVVGDDDVKGVRVKGNGIHSEPLHTETSILLLGGIPTTLRSCFGNHSDSHVESLLRPVYSMTGKVF
jgi:hypothetical protein